MPTLTIAFTPPATGSPAAGYVTKYRVKNSADAYTTLSPNQTSSPIVITGLSTDLEYEGTINTVCEFGTSTLVSFITCSCPVGYQKNPDNTMCYKIEEVPIIPPSGGVPQTATKRSNAAYSTAGSYIYSSFNYNGTGVSTKITLSNPFWFNGIGDGSNATGNGALTDDPTNITGPLNRSGVWAATTSDTQEIGYSTCFNSSVVKNYYIGVASDNYAKIILNSTTLIEQDIDAIGTQYALGTSAVFKVWHIYPIQVQAGPNIVTVIGHNVAGSAAFGFEIYEATSAEIISATSYADLGSKLIFSTKNVLGQNLQYGSGGAGYSCPVGYDLASCTEPYVCRKKSVANCGVGIPSGSETNHSGKLITVINQSASTIQILADGYIYPAAGGNASGNFATGITDTFKITMGSGLYTIVGSVSVGSAAIYTFNNVAINQVITLDPLTINYLTITR